MAVRVTDAEVRELIPSTSISDLTVFITAANIQVDALEDSECGSSLTTATLKEVERWLAAHFASVTDGGLSKKSEKFEGYSVTFDRGNAASREGLMSTQFGQMANTLSGGCLMESDKRKTKFHALGGGHYD